MANIKGIDISKWQGNITFSKVAKSTNFVIMKATEGYGYTDPKFLRNQQGLRNAGILTGYYHFARPDLGNTAEKEADWFIKTVGVLRKGELLALDYEVNYNSPVVWCKTFLDRVKTKTGLKPLIYINLATNNKYNWSPIVQGDYGLWLAYWDRSLTKKPKTDWPFIAIKQYGADTKVEGISGNVDGDIFFGDLTTLKKYGYQGSVINPPVEPPEAPEVTKLKEEIVALKNELKLQGEINVENGEELEELQGQYDTLSAEKTRIETEKAKCQIELSKLQDKNCVKQLIDKFLYWIKRLRR